MIIDLTDTSASKIGATLVQARRRAGSPTSTSPLSVKATTLGVRRLPS